MVWEDAYPSKHQALVSEGWREPLRGEPHGRERGNYRVPAGVPAGCVLGAFVVTYLVFR